MGRDPLACGCRIIQRRVGTRSWFVWKSPRRSNSWQLSGAFNGGRNPAGSFDPSLVPAASWPPVGGGRLRRGIRSGASDHDIPHSRILFLHPQLPVARGTSRPGADLQTVPAVPGRRSGHAAACSAHDHSDDLGSLEHQSPDGRIPGTDRTLVRDHDRRGRRHRIRVRDGDVPRAPLTILLTRGHSRPGASESPPNRPRIQLVPNLPINRGSSAHRHRRHICSESARSSRYFCSLSEAP